MRVRFSIMESVIRYLDIGSYRRHGMMSKNTTLYLAGNDFKQFGNLALYSHFELPRGRNGTGLYIRWTEREGTLFVYLTIDIVKAHREIVPRV